MRIRRATPSLGLLSAKGLLVMLALGVMTVHVPSPIHGYAGTGEGGSAESCGACGCGPGAGQGLAREPEAAASPGQSETEAPNDEPCCPEGCSECSLPCCGGVSVGAGLARTSPDLPAAAPIVPAGPGTPSAVELTDVFHPPRA